VDKFRERQELKKNFGKIKMEEQLVRKLKIIRNPTKKSARELLKALNKPGYEVSIKNKGEVIVRIDKVNVPMSLNDFSIKE
jgi:hypothetical protein